MSDEILTGSPSQEVTETQETTAAPVENTTQQVEQAAQTEAQKIKVKFNHEEKELALDEAIPLVQKGMNYDKLQERLNALQSNPALSFVEAQAQRYGLTPEQYIEAIKQQEEQERLNELIQRNIPEDLAKEIMANREFRNQYEQQQKELSKKQKEEAEALAFLEAYPDANTKELPDSFWQEVAQGKSMVDAYRSVEVQQLKTELAKLRETMQIREQNAANAQASTGSIMGQGNVQPVQFTRAQVEKMSAQEVSQNWKAIMESQKHWK